MDSYLVEEIQAIKLQLLPVAKLMQQLEQIRVSKKLKDSPDITFISLIGAELKEEIVNASKDVQVQLLKKFDQIYLQMQQNNDNFQDFSNSTLYNLSSLQEELLNCKNELTKIKQVIKENSFTMHLISEELNEKASAKTLGETIQAMNGLVTKYQLKELEVNVSLCAKSEDLSNLEKQVRNIELQIQKFAPKSLLQSDLAQMKKQMRSYINHGFSTKQQVQELKSQFQLKLSQSSESFKTLRENIKLNDQTLRDQINNYIGLLSAKPWQPLIDQLKTSISQKAEKCNIFQLRDEFNIQLKNFNIQQLSLLQKVSDFQSVIQRFDEVLLLKASKYDLSQISSKLNQYVVQSIFNQYSKHFTSTIASLQAAQSSISTSTQANKLEIKHLKSSIEKITQANFQAAHVSQTMSIFRDQMQFKADKTQISQIYDQMGHKHQVQSLKEQNALQERQLELLVVLSNELARTLLGNGESKSVLMKQRHDIFKNLNKLYNWVNGTGIAPDIKGFPGERLHSASSRLRPPSSTRPRGRSSELPLLKP